MTVQPSSVPDPFDPAPLPPVPDPVPTRVTTLPTQFSSGVESESEDNDTLYQFEGKNVHGTAAQLTSVGALEIADQVLRVDEFVNLEVEARVVSVRHQVNAKTGKLVRVHVLKAVDSAIKPWGPTV